MSRISCPYCDSVQVKAMSNQPKKYPRPVDPIALADWQRGYDCKKCGNDFIITPPKPIGFLGALIRIIFWLIVVSSVIAFFVKNNDSNTATSEPDSIEQIINETESENSDLKYNEGDPTPVAIEPTINQEFSKEAEEAAHAYIPPLEEQNPQREEQEQKSIADSQDQSETLSIKTTIRESE